MMAEFVQTMKDWRRMCAEMHDSQDDNKYNMCDICELNARDCAMNFDDSNKDTEYEEIERTVMAWAAEHPEPVYETWLEFIKRYETGKPKSDPDFICWMGTTPIPADIAEKLGIEPKEG